MRNPQIEGFRVDLADRNTKVVALLIASMTFGAALLLWLEPSTPSWSSSPLMAGAQRLDSVRVEYWPSTRALPADFDCLIQLDGTCVSRAEGSEFRLLIAGGEAEQVPTEQARALLRVFSSISGRPGFASDTVWLHPASDPRLHPDLPPAAHDLCNLMLRKGLIR